MSKILTASLCLVLFMESPREAHAAYPKVMFRTLGQQFGVIDLDYFAVASSADFNNIFYIREGEKENSSTCGQDISRSTASGKAVFGPLGSGGLCSVFYHDVPAYEDVFMLIRYSRQHHLPDTTKIEIYVDGQLAGSFTPIKTGNWDNFTSTAWIPIKFPSRPLAEPTIAALTRSSYEVFKKLRAQNGAYRDRMAFEVDTTKVASIAVAGMGLVALCIADELRYELDAVDLTLQTLRAFTDSTREFYWPRNKKGFYHHFVDLGSKKPISYSTYSTIDNAIFMLGAQFSKRYFRNAAISQLVDELYRSMDWNAVIANANTCKLYRELDENGVGVSLSETEPFNEYMLVAWLAHKYDEADNSSPADLLWQNCYFDTRTLPKLEYRGIPLLTDNLKDSLFVSNFVIQFPRFLCNYFTDNMLPPNSSYLHYFSNAMQADKLWWQENAFRPAHVWGLGAGACAKAPGYCVDTFNHNAEVISSPHIIAGFISADETAFRDLQRLYADSLGVYEIDGTTKILWRFSYADLKWRAKDLQGVDFATMLFGLASHRDNLGAVFFEQYNDFTSSVEEQAFSPQSLPVAFELSASFPNPFKAIVNLAIKILKPTEVRMMIYNLNGQLIRTLPKRALRPGNHSLVWDGATEHGKQVPAGVYFLHVKAVGEEVVRKVIFMP